MSNSKNIRVLTYNIWFSDNYPPTRFNEICAILRKSGVQPIGLQEDSFYFLLMVIEEIYLMSVSTYRGKKYSANNF